MSRPKRKILQKYAIFVSYVTFWHLRSLAIFFRICLTFICGISIFIAKYLTKFRNYFDYCEPIQCFRSQWGTTRATIRVPPDAQLLSNTSRF